jgi:hypothetical protein
MVAITQTKIPETACLPGISLPPVYRIHDDARTGLFLNFRRVELAELSVFHKQ